MDNSVRYVEIRLV